MFYRELIPLVRLSETICQNVANDGRLYTVAVPTDLDTHFGFFVVEPSSAKGKLGICANV